MANKKHKDAERGFESNHSTMVSVIFNGKKYNR